MSRPRGAFLVGWRGNRSRGPRMSPRRFRVTAQQLERLLSVSVGPPPAVRGLTTQISTAATKFHVTMGVAERGSIEHFARVPRRPKSSSRLGLRASRAVRIVRAAPQRPSRSCARAIRVLGLPNFEKRFDHCRGRMKLALGSFSKQEKWQGKVAHIF